MTEEAINEVAVNETVQKSGEELLNTVLANAIQKATDSASAAMDWAMVQIPDLIQQLLTWNLIQSIMLAVIFAAFSAFGFWMLYQTTKEEYRGEGGFAVVGFFMMVGCALPAVVQIFEAVKIWVAPKLWLLEYAVDLVGKATK